MIVEVLFDGKVVLTVPVEVRADGTLWSGQSPLINAKLLEEAGISKEEYGKAARAQKFTAEMLRCAMTLGDNPGGRFVRDKTAADRERAATAEAQMTPGNRERREIYLAFARAERCDRSQDDIEYQRLRWAAKERLEKWKKDYPEEYAAERADAVRAEAQHLLDLAAGAMLYDCDGSLSYADQCRRRDEFLAEAAQLLQGIGCADQPED